MDSPERGFSFQADGPLDMRMGPESMAMDAADIVNSWPESELGRIIRDYGEDRAWRRIAARSTPQASQHFWFMALEFVP